MPSLLKLKKNNPDNLVTLKGRERRDLDRQAYFLDDGQHDKTHFYPPLFKVFLKKIMRWALFMKQNLIFGLAWPGGAV